MDDGWIHIPRWGDFQHYKKRDPPWIKDYRSQIDNARYLELTLSQRGLLHDLRLLYLSMHRELPASRTFIASRLRCKTDKRSFDALNHAGFITISASTALDQRRVETDNFDFTSDENARDPDAVQRIQELAKTILETRVQ